MAAPQIPKDYFENEKRLLKICGVSLDKKIGKMYKIYSFIVLGLTPFGYLIPGTYEIFQPHVFEELCVIVLHTFSCGLAALKVATILRNRKKIITMLDKLHTGIFAPNFDRGGRAEHKLILECIKVNKFQRWFYLSVLALGIGGTIIAITIRRILDQNNKQFGFGRLTFIDTTRSPNFEILMAYQSFAYVSGGSAFTLIDLLFGNIMSNLCIQFRILQNSLKSIVEVSRTRISDMKFKNVFDPSLVLKRSLDQSLKEAVFHHLAIIDLAKEIEEIFSIVLLIVYVTNMAIICFLLYICSVLPVTEPRFTTFVGEIGIIGFQSFVICYWCDEVSRQSAALTNATYESNFVETNFSFQRNLAFIMRRSLNPTVITAGSFFGITLSTFTKTLQAAYSFFMVIRNAKAK